MTPYYQVDGITIYNADWLTVSDILDADSIPLIVTDPPYFQPAQTYCPARGKKYTKSVADLSILETAFRTWFDAIGRVLAPDGILYCFCDGQSYPLLYVASLRDLKRVRPLIWDKVVSYNGYTWRHQHELVLFGEAHESVRVPTGDGDILRCRAVPVKKREHPAEKPLELVRRLVAKHDAGLVCDPFMGSGTTLLAAKAEGREAVGVELDERYCELAVKRLEAAKAEGVL